MYLLRKEGINIMLKKNIDLEGRTILITGISGFIGANLAKKILNEYGYHASYDGLEIYL